MHNKNLTLYISSMNFPVKLDIVDPTTFERTLPRIFFPIFGDGIQPFMNPFTYDSTRSSALNPSSLDACSTPLPVSDENAPTAARLDSLTSNCFMPFIPKFLTKELMPRPPTPPSAPVTIDPARPA